MPRPASSIDDELARWLHSARRGDESGFTGIYRLLGGKVAGYLASRGVGEPDDVTNEVFLAAFRNLSTFDGDATRFRSWLFAIAWNKSADWHRAAARRPPLSDTGERGLAQIPGGDAEKDGVALMAAAEVDEMLATLTEDQRDVLMLRIVADLSLEQAAEALGKPVGAVKSLQHRGLLALKRTIFSQLVSPLS